MVRPTTKLGGCPDGFAMLAMLSAFVVEFPELDAEDCLDWVAVQAGLVASRARSDAYLAAVELRPLYARRLQRLGAGWWGQEAQWKPPRSVVKAKRLGNWLNTLEPSK
jgi:hypothetical protein